MLNPIVRLNARWVCSACFLVRRAPAGISGTVRYLLTPSQFLVSSWTSWRLERRRPALEGQGCNNAVGRREHFRC